MRPEELYASLGGTAAILRIGEIAFLPERQTRSVVLSEVLVAILHHTRAFRSLSEHLAEVPQRIGLLPPQDPRWREMLDALIAQGLLRSLDRWVVDAIRPGSEEPARPRALVLYGSAARVRAWQEAIGAAFPQTPAIFVSEEVAGEEVPAGLQRLRPSEIAAMVPSAAAVLEPLGDSWLRALNAALLLAAGEVVLFADTQLRPPLHAFPIVATGVNLAPLRMPEEWVALPAAEAGKAGELAPAGAVSAMLAPLGRSIGEWLSTLDPIDLAASAHRFAPSLVMPGYFFHRLATVTIGRRGRVPAGLWQFEHVPAPGVIPDATAYADWLHGPSGALGVQKPRVDLPRLGRLSVLDLRQLFPAPMLGKGAGAVTLWTETVHLLNPGMLGLSWPLTAVGDDASEGGWLLSEPVGSGEQLLADWVRRAGDSVRAAHPAERCASVRRWLEDYALSSDEHLKRELVEYRLVALSEHLRTMSELLHGPLPPGTAPEWREGLAIAFRRIAAGVTGGEDAPVPDAWRRPEAVRALVRAYARALGDFCEAYLEALERRPLERVLAEG